ncbi:Transmembrane emp24 domain-containing protein eca [Diplonema papillatum]|nr:Transmembrane emp24 domain-containing protein eca [Diplonema papillatum]
MSPSRLVAFLLVSAALAPSASASYFFFVKPAKYTCFAEDLDVERTIVHTSYETGPNIGASNILLDVITPRGATIHSELITKTVGSFQVTTSGVEGPHSLCLSVKGTEVVRISLSVEAHETGTGEWTEHTDPASGKKFFHNPSTKVSLWQLPADVTNSLSARDIDPDSTTEEAGATRDELAIYGNYMKSLEALMSQISEESAHLVERQSRFQGASSDTATAVFWMSMIQVGICFLIPAIQTFQLTRMLVKKKLV